MPDVFVAESDPSAEEPTRYGRFSNDTQQETPQAVPTPNTLPTLTPESDQTPDMPDLVAQDVNRSTQTQQEFTQFHTPETPENEETLSQEQQKFSVMPNYNLVHESHTSSIPLFTSYWQNPTGVYFDTQGAHEQILIFLRKHFITNVPWLISMSLFIAFPFALQFFLQYFHVNMSTFAMFTSSQVRVVITFYLLLIFTYGFIKFLSWYYNISLITQERVLDIELEDLVSKKVAATKISLVQDVTYQQTGAIRSMFDYGDVLIQTAGAQDNFIINSVPRPEMVIKTVEDIIGKGRSHVGV